VFNPQKTIGHVNQWLNRPIIQFDGLFHFVLLVKDYERLIESTKAFNQLKISTA
jgi:hypothetical protein